MFHVDVFIIIIGEAAVNIEYLPPGLALTGWSQFTHLVKTGD